MLVLSLEELHSLQEHSWTKLMVNILKLLGLGIFITSYSQVQVLLAEAGVWLEGDYTLQPKRNGFTYAVMHQHEETYNTATTATTTTTTSSSSSSSSNSSNSNVW